MSSDIQNRTIQLRSEEEESSREGKLFLGRSIWGGEKSFQHNTKIPRMEEEIRKKKRKTFATRM